MSATIGTIKSIVAGIRNAPGLAAELSDTADLVDGLALDSLEMLQLMLELEEKLAVRIDFERLEFAYLRSISVLAGFLDTMPPRQAPGPP